MQIDTIIQGRPFSARELVQIRTWLVAHPSWHRPRLARELCGRWGWRNEAGGLKDMACRSLPLKLPDRGWIQLPARPRASVNGSRNRTPVEVPHAVSSRHASLAARRPLPVEQVTAGSPPGRLFQCLLQRYHYLGQRHGVGENLQYLVRDRHARPVACLWFGSAAWQCRTRDAVSGWTALARPHSLRRLPNNTRFLIRPWVRVPPLAGHSLRWITRRRSGDWQDQYGQPIQRVATLVHRDRFAGTGYRAAGGIPVGTTTGRGRNAPGRAAPGPLKEVLLQPLRANFRPRLGA